MVLGASLLRGRGPTLTDLFFMGTMPGFLGGTKSSAVMRCTDVSFYWRGLGQSHVDLKFYV